MTKVTPEVLWAQRSNAEDASKNLIYLTIKVLDPVNVKLDLKPDSLSFSAGSQDNTVEYELNLQFYDEIDPENSQKSAESGNHIFLVLRKKNMQEEYWPRLTKEKLKLHYIKTNFELWVDEDEQEEQPENDDAANMMNMGGMGDMGGMGGMGGMDFSQLMQNMGGAGGAGGLGGDFDMSKLASQLGEAGAGNEDEKGDDEEAEEIKKD
ncbi:Piso0_005448 [Millerozyma farinosa CBS 7064]|uniref:Piso0_005448 protein n=1 Tax=Pichia sorbitophila (strain ATCC MYA-4447 / BCRC 22081 / CBS 7064 / NBRC 10061 / NRRL Y-12695) TaxID=559304 RepID=G8XZ16_PICSO|nr:Piso0_005448 [Millerozyma farinosa CBS 7064]